jgi:hypothetical protein
MQTVSNTFVTTDVSFLDTNGKDRKYGGGQGPRVVASFNTKQLAARG